MTSTRLLLLTVGVVVIAAMGALWSDALAEGEEVEIDEAEVFIEWNSTDTYF